MQYRERRIRVRAHQIWEDEDRPDGRDLDHWARAAEEVDAEGPSGTGQAPRAGRLSDPAPPPQSADEESVSNGVQEKQAAE